MTDFLIGIGVPKLYAGDIALMLLMVLTGIALMFIVKKTKIGAFAFAVYVAYFITEAAHFEFVDTYLVKSVIFLAVAIILHYSLFKPTVVIKLGGGNLTRWIKRIVISFTIVGFMVTIILGWMPDKEVLKMLSSFGLKVFTTDFAKFIWAVAPIITLFVVKQRE